MPRHSREFSATKNARSLGKDSSPPERILWSRLRSAQLDGLKFRRQYPIDPYVCDFFCSAAKLAVEVDGRGHEARAEHDRARDQFFEARGIRVVRLSASWITKDLDAVLELIRREAAARV